MLVVAVRVATLKHIGNILVGSFNLWCKNSLENGGVKLKRLVCDLSENSAG